MPSAPLPKPRNLENRVREAMEKRKNDFIAEGALYTRNRAAFVGPAEFLVMVRKWWRAGFEDAVKEGQANDERRR